MYSKFEINRIKMRLIDQFINRLFISILNDILITIDLITGKTMQIYFDNFKCIYENLSSNPCVPRRQWICFIFIQLHKARYRECHL
jgi:hypothetical protein